MVAMRLRPLFPARRPQRLIRGLAIVALVAAIASVVPAATYHCNFGMAEAGPICPSCHGEANSAASGTAIIDRGPCCSSEVHIGFGSAAPRDQTRDVAEGGRRDASSSGSGLLLPLFLTESAVSRVPSLRGSPASASAHPILRL